MSNSEVKRFEKGTQVQWKFGREVMTGYVQGDYAGETHVRVWTQRDGGDTYVVRREALKVIAPADPPAAEPQQAGYTAGPWEYIPETETDRAHIAGADDIPICVFYTHAQPSPGDAALIAAAPALAEAGAEVLRRAQYFISKHEAEGEHGITKNAAQGLAEPLAALRAALAAAGVL